jgi:hypothetical protein
MAKANTACYLVFSKFLDEGGNDLEEIADDSVVCYFEDWRVLVFVDCGDGAGALYAHDALNGAAHSERKSCGRQLLINALAVTQPIAGEKPTSRYQSER